MVNGPLRGEKEKGNSNHSISASRISLVNLHELLFSQYNTHFNEKSYEDTKKMFIEDKQVMKIAEDSDKIVDWPLQSQFTIQER